ncbi:VPDSG-CTERM sorting domain-containing protein [Limisphaera sp. VF-2]|jgi:hypothetical protein|uniref:VPDSG-CTERM sorting domain-containing protein n=1 Tax=Limisphaera sp. VF-2 TaxID=3400418 RepID=UPI0017685364
MEYAFLNLDKPKKQEVNHMKTHPVRIAVRASRVTGLAIVMGALLCAGLNLRAVPIRLDTAPYIHPSTSVPGNPPNQGENVVYAWLKDLVAAYNILNDPDLPDPDSPPIDEHEEQSKDVTTLTIQVTGTMYLTVHWGGPQEDPNNDHSQAWYLGGSLTSFTLTAPDYVTTNTQGKKSEVVIKHFGLSGYREWGANRIPDVGATVALLGLGLLVLAGHARQRRYRTP